jgi:hypothetical protein
VSFLYVFGTGILTLSFFGVLNRGVEFAARLKEIDSDLFFIATPLFATTSSALLALSIPAGRRTCCTRQLQTSDASPTKPHVSPVRIKGKPYLCQPVAEAHKSGRQPASRRSRTEKTRKDIGDSRRRS